MGFVRQVTDKDPKAQIEPFENVWFSRRVSCNISVRKAILKYYFNERNTVYILLFYYDTRWQHVLF